MARISVRLTPRGGRDAIDGWSDDTTSTPVLRVRVASAPVEGAANDALVRLLAKALGIPPSQVSIVSGAQGRMKIVEVASMSDDEARECVDTYTAARERRR